MDIRTRACFALSRKWMHPPAERTVDYGAYGDWRSSSLSQSWAAFSDVHIDAKDILDFGCGDGQLSLFLAKEKRPRKMLGVDLSVAAIDRAKASLATAPWTGGIDIDFAVGSTERLPVADQSFDTLLAFDCLEHVCRSAARCSQQVASDCWTWCTDCLCAAQRPWGPELLVNKAGRNAPPSDLRYDCCRRPRLMRVEWQCG